MPLLWHPLMVSKAFSALGTRRLAPESDDASL